MHACTHKHTQREIHTERMSSPFQERPNATFRAQLGFSIRWHPDPSYIMIAEGSYTGFRSNGIQLGL